METGWEKLIRAQPSLIGTVTGSGMDVGLKLAQSGGKEVQRGLENELPLSLPLSASGSQCANRSGLLNNLHYMRQAKTRCMFNFL